MFKAKECKCNKQNVGIIGANFGNYNNCTKAENLITRKLGVSIDAREGLKEALIAIGLS